jgi:hypothetical protein
MLEAELGLVAIFFLGVCLLSCQCKCECVSSIIGVCQTRFSIVGPCLVKLCGCWSVLPRCNLSLGCGAGYFLASRVCFQRSQVVLVAEATFGVLEVALGYCFSHFCVWRCGTYVVELCWMSFW